MLVIGDLGIQGQGIIWVVANCWKMHNQLILCDLGEWDTTVKGINREWDTTVNGINQVNQTLCHGWVTEIHPNDINTYERESH